MSFFRTLLTVLLLAIMLPFAANAQKITKKQLLKERVEMQRTIDSLKLIIEGGALEMSDTTQFEDNQEGYNGINYIDSELFADVDPGCNPDSLMSMWYIQKKLTLNDAERDLDSIVLSSNIPDDVYIERLNKINSRLAAEVRSVLDENKSERHLRGGMATKQKYSHHNIIV